MSCTFLGGDVAQDEQQENYEQKFQEMQKYIPFLEMMIQRLERSSDKSREAQLLKMKSLHSILSNTRKKYATILEHVNIVSEV
jgi:exonuclease VII small subunit